jgi:signal transduction histidine kinase
VQSLLQQKEQPLAADLPEPLPVRGDRVRLEQVLVNLLSNAHRHTPRGTQITVAGRCSAGEVRLAVRDGGPGIPAAQLETIFGPFQRGGRQSDGMGLGLAIARDVATAHGGRLWAESAPGQGAVFHLVLPRATATNGADDGDGAAGGEVRTCP